MSNNGYSYRRIAAAFTLVIVIMATITALGLFQINRVSNQLDYLVDVHNVENDIMHAMLRIARERSLAIQTMLLQHDPFEWDEQARIISNLGAEYVTLHDQLLALDLPEELSQLHQQQHTSTLQTGTLQTEIVNLIREEQYEQANQLLYQRAIPSQAHAMSLMQNFIDQLHHDSQRRVDSSRELINRAIMQILVLLICGIIAGLVIATTVTQRLNHEIQRRNEIEDELEHRVEDRTRELTYLASHDALTTLPNRSVFSAQLEIALKHAARNEKIVALFFMDLDGFKAINDSRGHAIGDRVLVETCARLRDATREEDVLARLGGDEFTLIISDLEHKSDAFIVADKIIEVINLPLHCNEHTCHIGISIGIAFFPDDAITPDALLTRADDAMYAAKRSGKNRYTVAA